ncbi:MAG: hypothetical protein WCM76_06710 [Bacteroidota bacterium]
MKKLFIILACAVILVSCEKRKENKNSCPVVPAEAVPVSVNSAFQEKYPNVVAEKWFNKDNTGYCVLITLNGQKKLCQFNTDGSFVNEQTDIEQQGDHQDNNDNNSSCECDTGDKD